MKKQIYFFALLTYFTGFVYSIDMNDFTVVHRNEEFALCESVDLLLEKFPAPVEKIWVNQHNAGKEPEKTNYVYDGLLAQGGMGKIHEMLITSDKYKLKSGIKVGDSIKRVLAHYKDLVPDTGNSNSEYTVLLYTFYLPRTSWKEPQNLLFLRFKDDILISIDMLYLDWG